MECDVFVQESLKVTSTFEILKIPGFLNGQKWLLETKGFKTDDEQKLVYSCIYI